MIGGYLYFYNKPHISNLEDKRTRIVLRFGTTHHSFLLTFIESPHICSVYGSTMAGLGSLLLWAMLKAIMPENPTLRTAVAIGSSYVLLRTGTRYVEVIESLGKSSPK